VSAFRFTFFSHLNIRMEWVGRLEVSRGFGLQFTSKAFQISPTSSVLFIKFLLIHLYGEYVYNTTQRV
jgi:hypothetical protein